MHDTADRAKLAKVAAKAFRNGAQTRQGPGTPQAALEEEIRRSQVTQTTR